MGFNIVQGTPGIKATREATPRKVVMGEAPLWVYPGGKLVDGAASRDPGHTGFVDILRPGTFMGRITGSGKYAPSFCGKLVADYTSGGTTLNIGIPAATEVLRRGGASGLIRVVGAPTATGVVAITGVVYSAVNVGAGTLTITSPGVNIDEGALIGFNDGSVNPVAVIGDGYGIKVTDEDGANVDVPFVPMLVGAILDVPKLPLWPDAEDTTLAAWIRDQLGRHFLFSDIY